MKSAHSLWTTLGLPQPKAECASQVCTAQAPGCPARTLSHMGPALWNALSSSKPLRFLGTPQGHRPGWAVCFVSFPGLSSSGDWVLSERTVPGGLCILISSQVHPLGFLGVPRENCLRCAMCLLWGADLRLHQPWGRDCSSPMTSSSGCCTPASLPPGWGGAYTQPLVFAQSFVLWAHVPGVTVLH